MSKKFKSPDIEVYNDEGEMACGDYRKGETFEELEARVKEELGGSGFKVVVTLKEVK